MKLASLFPPGRIRRGLAATSYLAAVLGLVAGARWLASSLYDEDVGLTAMREQLHQLEVRMASAARRPGSMEDAEQGSPFIEGATITQAGAALQQRMERAVARVGGALLSSQVELETPGRQPGFLSLSADIELPEPALQAFLYDIEAGMPYLFIDAFSAEAPHSTEDARGVRLRVALAVSGKWEARP